MSRLDSAPPRAMQDFGRLSDAARWPIGFARDGWVAERFKAAVLKTAEGLPPP